VFKKKLPTLKSREPFRIRKNPKTRIWAIIKISGTFLSGLKCDVYLSDIIVKKVD
jgi:hypothetical protein